LMSDTEVIATKTLDERESISQGMEMSEWAKKYLHKVLFAEFTMSVQNGHLQLEDRYWHVCELKA
jgi:hypothetical protein